MTISQLQTIFEQNRDIENAVKQEAYLKDQFMFLGLPKPKRAKLEKEFVKATKSLNNEQIIDICFELTSLGFREYMYTAQSVLHTNYKKLNYNDIERLVQLTLIDSWWENTDGFQSVLKKWFRENPQYIRQFVESYYKHPNMWLRRLAIIAQLGLKEQTDFVIMKRALRYNFNYDEFFIQKAIGWALRDYSKSNSVAVAEFIGKYQAKMSNLAIREGSKYIS